MKIDSFSLGGSVNIGKLKPSILSKFKGREIILSYKDFKVTSPEFTRRVIQENKSLCSHLISCSNKKATA